MTSTRNVQRLSAVNYLRCQVSGTYRCVSTFRRLEGSYCLHIQCQQSKNLSCGTVRPQNEDRTSFRNVDSQKTRRDLPETFNHLKHRWDSLQSPTDTSAASDAQHHQHSLARFFKNRPDFKPTTTASVSSCQRTVHNGVLWVTYAVWRVLYRRTKF